VRGGADLLASRDDALSSGRGVVRRGQRRPKPILDGHLDAEAGVRRSARSPDRKPGEGSGRERVIERLEQVGPAVPVGTEERHTLRREREIRVFQVPEAPDHQAFEPHRSPVS
jgi:hypothetical protein